MMSDIFELSVKQPVSAWNKPLKANFKDLFKALSKAAIDGVVGKWDGLAQDIVDASTALGLGNDPGQVAWLLIYRSLTAAMATLVEEQQELLQVEEQDLETLCQPLDLTLENQQLAIGQDFFHHPDQFVILEDIKIPFRQWLSTLGLNEAAAAAIATRLPAYFCNALNEEWCQHPEDYNVLLQRFNTPFSQVNEQVRAWLRYASWLQKQVEEPVFQEAFGLKQVYVWPRAYYRRKIKTKEGQSRSQHRDIEAGRQERVVVNLETALNQWLEIADKDDTIRVISGGPGSGKSSFTKMFAAAQAERICFTGGGTPLRVLFVPLHRFDFLGDLVDAVGAFVQATGILPHNPLALESRESRLLLIFDGLDELSMQGQIATEVAQHFVREVQKKVSQLNYTKTRVQAILSGREMVVQASRSEFRKPQQILHLLPYFVTESERQDKQQPFVDPEQLLAADRRQDWWQCYGRTTGREYEGLPEALARKSLIEITAQPLLNYLVALSFARGKLDFAKTHNLNAIYADLIEGVYDRGWAQAQHPSLQGIELEDFVRILEEVALAIWHRDGRTASLKAIEERCSRSGLADLLAAFQVGAKQGIARLLTAFYFRQSSVAAGEKTFEFTHKSFGEYLTARRIVREIDLIDEELARHRRDRDRGWDDSRALERWASLCGPTTIDQYRLQFIGSELELWPTACVAQCQQTVSHLIEVVLHSSMPMEKLPLTFHQAAHQSCNAEIVLLAVLNACARVTKIVSTVAWPTPEALSSWLAKLVGQRPSSYKTSLVFKCLSYLNLQHCCLIVKDLIQANLRYSDLGYAKLCDAVLNYADLSKANLRYADLRYAKLSKAVLSKAVLIEANLRYAVLRNAVLRNANFRNADLSSANLSAANLSAANLSAANLSNAILIEANLSAANLSNTVLIEAVLNNTNLSNTNLSSAVLIEANLSFADLSFAVLVEANCRDTDLSFTDLSSADLSGADLSGADLSGADLYSSTCSICTYNNLQGVKTCEACGAGLSANLCQVRGLTSKQVKVAKGWEYACYSKELRSALGFR